MKLILPRHYVKMTTAAMPARINQPDSDSEEELPLAEIPMPPVSLASMPEGTECHAYRLGECSVIITRECGYHLSIAHPHRDPTWSEIAQARYRLLPDDCWMAMYLPPRSHYVNVHRFCFQMTEVSKPQEGKIP